MARSRHAAIGSDHPSKEEVCEFMENVDSEERPYNFDRDAGKKRVWGRDPFELFEEG